MIFDMYKAAIPMSEQSQPNSAKQRTTVFFDGSCPLCAAEIDIYRQQDKIGALDLVDISESDSRLPVGLQREQAIARFHVIAQDGRLLSGAIAFAEVWTQLPGWHWAGKVAQLPVIQNILEFGYRIFLHLRPAFVRLFLIVRRNRR